MTAPARPLQGTPDPFADVPTIGAGDEPGAGSGRAPEPITHRASPFPNPELAGMLGVDPFENVAVLPGPPPAAPPPPVPPVTRPQPSIVPQAGAADSAAAFGQGMAGEFLTAPFGMVRGAVGTVFGDPTQEELENPLVRASIVARMGRMPDVQPRPAGAPGPARQAAEQLRGLVTLPIDAARAVADNPEMGMRERGARAADVVMGGAGLLHGAKALKGGLEEGRAARQTRADLERIDPTAWGIFDDVRILPGEAPKGPPARAGAPPAPEPARGPTPTPPSPARQDEIDRIATRIEQLAPRAGKDLLGDTAHEVELLRQYLGDLEAGRGQEAEALDRQAPTVAPPVPRETPATEPDIPNLLRYLARGEDARMTRAQAEAAYAQLRREGRAEEVDRLARDPKFKYSLDRVPQENHEAYLERLRHLSQAGGIETAPAAAPATSDADLVLQGKAQPAIRATDGRIFTRREHAEHGDLRQWAEDNDDADFEEGHGWRGWLIDKRFVSINDIDAELQGAPAAGQAPERVRAAAVEIDGRRFEGPDHFAAIVKAQDAGVDVDQAEGARHGYVTDRGRFIDDREAATLARAAKQLSPSAEKRQVEQLDSGDLPLAGRSEPGKYPPGPRPVPAKQKPTRVNPLDVRNAGAQAFNDALADYHGAFGHLSGYGPLQVLKRLGAGETLDAALAAEHLPKPPGIEEKIEKVLRLEQGVNAAQEAAGIPPWEPKPAPPAEPREPIGEMGWIALTEEVDRLRAAGDSPELEAAELELDRRRTQPEMMNNRELAAERARLQQVGRGDRPRAAEIEAEIARRAKPKGKAPPRSEPPTAPPRPPAPAARATTEDLEREFTQLDDKADRTPAEDARHQAIEAELEERDRAEQEEGENYGPLSDLAPPGLKIDPNSRYADEEDPAALWTGALAQARGQARAFHAAQEQLARGRNEKGRPWSKKERAKLEGDMRSAEMEFDGTIAEVGQAFGHEWGEHLREQLIAEEEGPRRFPEPPEGSPAAPVTGQAREYVSLTAQPGRELTAEQLHTRKIAQDLKAGSGTKANRAAIEEAATEMAQRIPRGAVIVPLPGASPGSAADMTGFLADAIAKKVGGQSIAAVQRAKGVRSSVLSRRAGKRPPTLEEHIASMKSTGLLEKHRKGRPVVLIDNVEVTGNTARAVRDVLQLPDDTPLVTYARAEIPELERSAPTPKVTTKRERKASREQGRLARAAAASTEDLLTKYAELTHRIEQSQGGHGYARTNDYGETHVGAVGDARGADDQAAAEIILRELKGRGITDDDLVVAYHRYVDQLPATPEALEEQRQAELRRQAEASRERGGITDEQGATDFDPSTFASEGIPQGRGERIRAATVRDPRTGKWYEGRTHADAMEKAADAGASWAQLEELWDRGEDDLGFITDRGRHVTREEALAIARRADQLRNPEDFTGEHANSALVAEDLKTAPRRDRHASEGIPQGKGDYLERGKFSHEEVRTRPDAVQSEELGGIEPKRDRRQREIFSATEVDPALQEELDRAARFYGANIARETGSSLAATQRNIRQIVARFIERGISPEADRIRYLRRLAGDDAPGRPRDLFGTEEPDTSPEQGSMFGEKAGTEASRSTTEQTRALSAERDKLRVLIRGKLKDSPSANARLAELERLLNRDQKIGADEMSTRARADTPEQLEAGDLGEPPAGGQGTFFSEGIPQGKPFALRGDPSHISTVDAVRFAKEYLGAEEFRRRVREEANLGRGKRPPREPAALEVESTARRVVREAQDKPRAMRAPEEEAEEEPAAEPEVKPPEAKPVGPIKDALLRLLAPASRSGGGIEEGRIVRHRAGELAAEMERARERLADARKAVASMKPADRLRFIDDIEAGRPIGGKLGDAAAAMRQALDQARDEVRALGTGKLQHFYVDYFPHIWKDPKGARDVILKILGKRPLEGPRSFLKRRSMVTVGEGIQHGLELATENPADLVLLKLREMRRYIMGQRILADMKREGLAKFVPAMSRAPGGYARIDDHIAMVYGPPDIPVMESYDPKLREGLEKVLAALGGTHTRSAKLPRLPRLGEASGGLGEAGKGHVATRFATDVTVLEHELGHIIDNKLGLWDRLVEPPGQEEHTVTRGKRKGQRIKRTVQQERALVEHRKTIREELRQLADLRFEGHEEGVTKHYKDYVREKPEQMANAIHAIVYAPERMQEIAPTVKAKLTEILKSDPRTAPLLKLEKSLVAGTAVEKFPVGGLVIKGQFWAPEPAAKVLQNYLAPGLRGNPLYDAYMGVGNALNQAQLGMSAFHLGFTSVDASTSKLALAVEQLVSGHPIKAAVSAAHVPIAPLTTIWQGAKLRRAYLRPGSEGAEFDQLADALVQAGGRVRQPIEFTNNSIGQFMEALRARRPGGVLRHALGAAIELQAKPILEIIVPRQKLGVFADLARFELQKLERGGMRERNAAQMALGRAAAPQDVRAVMAKVWDSVDNRMGQLVYDNLFWSRTLKDLAMASTRSVGWNLGTIRELGGGGLDLARGRLTHRAAYVLALPVTVGLAGAVMTYLYTGHGPRELKDYFLPPTGRVNEDGNEERVQLPSYVKDLIAYGRHPVQTVGHKLQPLLATLADMLQNRDYYGDRIRNVDDPLVVQLTQEAEYLAKQWVPFGIRNALQERQHGQSATTKLAPFVGITPAPRELVRSPAQQRMAEILERQGHAERNPEEVVASDRRRKILEGVREGSIKWRALMDSTRAGALSYRQAEGVDTRGREIPMVVRYKQLSWQDAEDVYRRGTPEERRRWWPVLWQKRLDALTQLASTGKSPALDRLKSLVAREKLRGPVPAGLTAEERGALTAR